MPYANDPLGFYTQEEDVDDPLGFYQEEKKKEDKDDPLGFYTTKTPEPARQITPEQVSQREKMLPHETPEEHAARVYRVEHRPEPSIYTEEEEKEMSDPSVVKDTISGMWKSIKATPKVVVAGGKRLAGERIKTAGRLLSGGLSPKTGGALREGLEKVTGTKIRETKPILGGISEAIQKLGRGIQESGQRTMDETDIPKFTKDLFAGIGGAIVDLPLFNAFVGKFGIIKGPALLGSLDGLSKGDIKRALVGTVAGGGMGKILKVASPVMGKIKDKYLQYLTLAGGGTGISAAEQLALGEDVDFSTLVSSGLTLAGMHALGRRSAGKAARQRTGIKNIKKALSVEAEFKKMGAEELGFAFKNANSLKSMIEEYTMRAAKDQKKLYRDEDAIDVVLSAVNPDYFSSLPLAKRSAVKAAKDHLLQFMEEGKQEYAGTGANVDFKQRIIGDIRGMIKTAKTPIEKAEFYKMLQYAKKMNFVHIPASMWFKNAMMENPKSLNKTLRLTLDQGRKTLSIETLLDKKIISPEQVNPIDIMMNYGRRIASDKAILEIRNGGIKDGMVVEAKQMKATTNKNPKLKEAYKNFEDPPPNVPFLEGHKVHPLFAEYLADTYASYQPQTKFGKLMSTTKMWQFINPFFLPMYDTVQGIMLGSLTSLKTPKYIYQGIKDVWTRSPERWSALENGLESKPYNNPFASWQKMGEWIKSKKGYAFERLKEMLPKEATATELAKTPFRVGKGILEPLYNASWFMAWKLDGTIRQISYRYLLDKGFSARDSAQLAASFHADYASVPEGTRRALNKMWFTPTFKIVMAKLFGKMMKGAWENTVKLGKGDPKSKVYAKGLLRTAGILVGTEILMHNLGFTSDETGRKYIKEVDIDGEQKELAVTFSHPANMFIKYPARLIKTLSSPYQENPAKEFLEKNKWEIHPFYRTGYEIINNDDGLGGQVYNPSPFDDTPTQIGKSLIYAGKNLVRMVGIFDKGETDVEAKKLFKKEAGWLLNFVTGAFAWKYIRGSEERRKFYYLNKIKKKMREMFLDGELTEEELEKTIQKINNLLNEQDEKENQ